MVAVTITVCAQVGIEQWHDFRHTKVFNKDSTIGEIDTWIKSHGKALGFASVVISQVDE